MQNHIVLYRHVHLHYRELRQQIEPEIRELVRQQRLAQLVEGEYFKQVFKGRFKSGL